MRWGVIPTVPESSSIIGAEGFPLVSLPSVLRTSPRKALNASLRKCRPVQPSIGILRSHWARGNTPPAPSPLRSAGRYKPYIHSTIKQGTNGKQTPLFQQMIDVTLPQGSAIEKFNMRVTAIIGGVRKLRDDHGVGMDPISDNQHARPHPHS